MRAFLAMQVRLSAYVERYVWGENGLPELVR